MKKVLIVLLLTMMSISLCACGPKNDENVQNETAEVVIIGGGAAGISGAIKAAEQGIHVILLEKQAFLGGATIMASTGINAGDAALQKETEVPYTADMFYEYALTWDYGYDRIGYRVTPVADDVAYTFAYNSADAADWIASLGIEMKASSDSHSLQLITKENGAFGQVYTAALQEELKKYDNIDVRLENKATELLVDENGAITGVKVENNNDTYIIDTTAVILASGGYANADSDFWEKYAPEWDGYYVTGAASATGDGIIMADALGAKLDGMDAVTCTPLTVGQANTAGATSISSNKTGAILVNKEGKRFVNETSKTAEMMEALKAQTDQEAWLIADKNVLDANTDLTSLMEKGLLIEAQTIEELAKSISLDEAILTETLNTYAENLANQADEFGKEGEFNALDCAPYYAVIVKAAKRITTGGIVINGKAEVINNQNEVITGLYAAGEVTSYGAHPLSAATIFGRQAADSVKAFLNK